MSKSRRDAPPPIFQTPIPGATPGRSTMAVANARRVIARALPSVIYQNAPRARASLAPLADKPKGPLPDRAAPVPVKSSGLTVKPLESCKARPSDSRKGGGSGRAFVPWCKR